MAGNAVPEKALSLLESLALGPKQFFPAVARALVQMHATPAEQASLNRDNARVLLKRARSAADKEHWEHVALVFRAITELSVPPENAEDGDELCATNVKHLLAEGVAKVAVGAWIACSKVEEFGCCTSIAESVCEIAVTSRQARSQLRELFVPLFFEHLTRGGLQYSDYDSAEAVARALTVLIAKSGGHVVHFRTTFSSSEWAQRLKHITHNAIAARGFPLQRALTELIWRFLRLKGGATVAANPRSLAISFQRELIQIPAENLYSDLDAFLLRFLLEDATKEVGIMKNDLATSPYVFSKIIPVELAAVESRTASWQVARRSDMPTPVEHYFLCGPHATTLWIASDEFSREDIPTAHMHLLSSDRSQLLLEVEVQHPESDFDGETLRVTCASKHSFDLFVSLVVMTFAQPQAQSTPSTKRELQESTRARCDRVQESTRLVATPAGIGKNSAQRVPIRGKGSWASLKLPVAINSSNHSSQEYLVSDLSKAQADDSHDYDNGVPPPAELDDEQAAFAFDSEDVSRGEVADADNEDSCVVLYQCSKCERLMKGPGSHPTVCWRGEPKERFVMKRVTVHPEALDASPASVLLHVAIDGHRPRKRKSLSELNLSSRANSAPGTDTNKRSAAKRTKQQSKSPISLGSSVPAFASQQEATGERPSKFGLASPRTGMREIRDGQSQRDVQELQFSLSQATQDVEDARIELCLRMRRQTEAISRLTEAVNIRLEHMENHEVQQWASGRKPSLTNEDEEME